MENKDLYHFICQIEQFWDYYPFEMCNTLNNEDNDIVLNNETDNKQEQILYF